MRRHYLLKDSKEAWSSLQRGEGKLNYGKILSDYSQQMGCARTCMEGFKAEVSVCGRFYGGW